MPAQLRRVDGAQNKMSDDNFDIEHLLEGRIATYGFLSRLYRLEVDQELLDEMCAMRFPTKTGNDDVDAANQLFCSYLNTVWERTLTELAVDYTRVFLGGGIDAYSASYPFESVYTSSKRLLMQEARDEVLAIYRANNIKVSSTVKLNEDHISLEMEFLQVLGKQALEAFRSDDGQKAAELLMTSYGFLMEHLISWTPLFLVDMKKFAKTDFYQALALMTSGFLAVDRELLEGLLAEELEAVGNEWNKKDNPKSEE